MPEVAPTSVILPTVRWNDACDEIAAQLGEQDELIVVCDSESDSVADRIGDLPPRTQVVIAGEPGRCSGKANAIAAGMEAAGNDRLVWTDDDFFHPPEWLETLRADYEERGPTSECPVFVGRDPLSMLLEPQYALGGTLAVYADDIAWGGAVIFDRADLDEDTFLEDLRRTISDDGLLTEYVDMTTVKRVRPVEIGGSIRETLERHARFVQIVRYHDPVGTIVSGVVATGVAVASLVFPLYAMAVLTLTIGGVYASFGNRRWTFLLAYPAVLAAIPLLVYGLTRRSFVWSGRRYRWHSKFDVSVETD